MDKHGNKIAQEGCTRCACGCKYWENDVCVDCGEAYKFRLCEGCHYPLLDPDDAATIYGDASVAEEGPLCGSCEAGEVFL